MLYKYTLLRMGTLFRNLSQYHCPGDDDKKVRQINANRNENSNLRSHCFAVTFHSVGPYRDTVVNIEQR